MSIIEAEMPTANIATPQSLIDSPDFVTLSNVPVFREHETISQNTGKKLSFAKDDLQRVVDGCNRRINDTGDYALLSYGHTSDNEAIAAPETAGFAGPFKLGKLPLADGKECYCILADFHIPKDDVQKFKRYPRRSPELWTGENGEMHLDPIALLGSIPPRLDMGLTLFQRKTANGVERYQASSVAPAAPASNNVYIPGGDEKKTKQSDKEQYAMNATDLKQVMDAFDQLDWVQAIKQYVAEDRGVNSTIEEEPEEFAAPEVSGDDAPPELEGEGMPTPEPGIEAEVDSEPGLMTSAPPPEEPTVEAGVEGPSIKNEESYAEAPREGLDEAMAVTAEATEEQLGPEVAEEVVEEAPNPNAMMYAMLDGIEDDAFEEYCRYRSGKTEKYMAEEEGCDGVHIDIESHDDETDEKMQYQKPDEESQAEKYSRKANDRIAELEANLRTERYQRVNTERYAALQGLMADRVFDLDAEYERCAADKMSDDQFREQYQAIQNNYVRRPVNMPHFEMRQPVGGEFSDDSKERYQRKESDAARDYCEKQVKKGNYVSFKEGLEHVRNSGINNA
jgi:hypothetical protein